MKIRKSFRLVTYPPQKQGQTQIKEGFMTLKEYHQLWDVCKGGRMPFVIIRANTKKGYEEAEHGDSVNFSYPKSTTRRGRVGKQVAQTITASPPIKG